MNKIKTPKQRTFFRRTALKNLSLLVILLFIKQALIEKQFNRIHKEKGDSLSQKVFLF